MKGEGRKILLTSAGHQDKSCQLSIYRWAGTVEGGRNFSPVLRGKKSSIRACSKGAPGAIVVQFGGNFRIKKNTHVFLEKLEVRLQRENKI